MQPRCLDGTTRGNHAVPGHRSGKAFHWSRPVDVCDEGGPAGAGRRGPIRPSCFYFTYQLIQNTAWWRSEIYTASARISDVVPFHPRPFLGSLAPFATAMSWTWL